MLQNQEGLEETDEFIQSLPADRVLIHTADELAAMSGVLSGTYVLMKDIDLSGVSWTPIGTASNPFTRTFYGNGHVLKNLTITGNSSYIGLFGYIVGGTVDGLGMVNFSITGTYCVGGIAGRCEGTIKDCYNLGTISAGPDSTYIGGIAGYAVATIQGCFNTGSVSAGSNSSLIGGIVGSCNNHAITNCYNTGNITSPSTAYGTGGIAGFCNGAVEYCYNTGSVRGSLVDDIDDEGTNYGPPTGRITGGQGTATITSCYYLALMSSDRAEEGTSADSDALKDRGTYTGWDFTTVWAIDSSVNGGYPYLRALKP